MSVLDLLELEKLTGRRLKPKKVGRPVDQRVRHLDQPLTSGAAGSYGTTTGGSAGSQGNSGLANFNL